MKRASLRRLRGLKYEGEQFWPNLSSWEMALFLNILSDLYRPITRTIACHTNFFYGNNCNMNRDNFAS